jgi:hypothetical protein
VIASSPIIVRRDVTLKLPTIKVYLSSPHLFSAFSINLTVLKLVTPFVTDLIVLLPSFQRVFFCGLMSYVFVLCSSAVSVIVRVLVVPAY